MALIIDEEKSEKIFGKSYNKIGNTNSNLLLKTKGSIKIQWGRKFFDLIKDGKLNIDTKFIYTVSDSSSIGNSDGIYVLNSGDVYLKVGDQTILLVDGEGTTYVSFMSSQETTSDQKYNALHNIGFYYESLEDLDENIVLNGIVYIESEQKLYVIVDGVVSEMSFSIPNPITEQLVISKNNTDSGAIYIQGYGIENSLRFDGLYIYVDEDEGSYIYSDDYLNIIIDEKQIATISRNMFKIASTIICNTIQSSTSASENNGFRLYIDSSGNSVLEVDKINVRQGDDSVFIYPTYWLGNINIITDVSIVYNNSSDEDEDTNDNEEDSSDDTLTYLQITLMNESTYQEGDVLILFVPNDDDGYTIYTQITVTVTSTGTSTIDVSTSDNFDIEDITSISNGYIFKIQSGTEDEEYLPIRLNGTNLDIIDYSNNEEINLRIGNLTELNKNGISGYGFYSNQGFFKNASYSSDYVLDEDDDSPKFASTEWSRRCVLPYGSIVLYNGTTAPSGWQICDGTNNTPDLSQQLPSSSVIYIMKVLQ